MGIILNPYPTLTEKMIDAAGIKIEGGNNKTGPLSFDYIDSNGRRNNLSYERTSAVGEYYKLCEEDLYWHPEENNLLINVPLTIKVPQELFGDKGIVPPNAIIGIGVEWSCKGSLIRGAAKLLTLNYYQGKIDKKNYEFCIDKKTLRETLTLDVVVYLVRNDEYNSRFATVPGTILGSIFNCVLAISGDGSIFPIKEVEVAGEPLWWVSGNFDDPCNDSFDSSNFCLYINKAHASYISLGLNDNANGGLISDIVASALQILIEECIKDDNTKRSILNNESAPDSLGFVVGNIIQTPQILSCIDNPSEMAKAIRKYYLEEEN